MSRAQKILEMALLKPPILLDTLEESNNISCSMLQQHNDKTVNCSFHNENIAPTCQHAEQQPDHVVYDTDEGFEVEDIIASDVQQNINVWSQNENLVPPNFEDQLSVEANAKSEEKNTEILTDTENIVGASTIEEPMDHLTEENITEEEDSEEATSSVSKRKRVKRRHVREGNWKREYNKRNRELGKQYEGKKCINTKWQYNITKPQRVLKKRCSCKISVKNQNIAKKPTLQCYLLSDDDRNQIFEDFWKLNWGERKLFVQLNMNCTGTHRHRDRKEEKKSRRMNSFSYYLKKNNESIKVCKQMFINTLGIGEWSARAWKTEKSQEHKHMTAEENQNAVTKHRETPNQETKRKRMDVKRIECLKQFFENLPKMESHYCRSTSKKLYLEPEWKSKQELYELYSNDWCVQRKEQPFSITYFDHYFNDLNLSLFTRKKDECELCVTKNVNNISEEEYTLHQEKKKEAREEKEKDKTSSRNKVYTMDLQAVLLCPKSNVSSLYYKTKLAVHNFTIYDIKSHAGYCFIWSETEGTVGANEFSTIICSFAESQLPQLETGERLIFYSDGCTGQNRNAILSSALLNFAVHHKVPVVQKYLERGHTQMEADSIHSCVERQLRNKIINVPADYINVVESARKRPEPYHVRYLEYNFFKNFGAVQCVPSIRPGKKTGDPTVTDIRALLYNPDGTIQFKLRHSEDWQVLPVRHNKKVNLGVSLHSIPSLYSEKLKIKKEKFQHLQSLKNTMPSDYHAFYNNLQHL